MTKRKDSQAGNSVTATGGWVYFKNAPIAIGYYTTPTPFPLNLHKYQDLESPLLKTLNTILYQYVSNYLVNIHKYLYG